MELASRQSCIGVGKKVKPRRQLATDGYPNFQWTGRGATAGARARKELAVFSSLFQVHLPRRPGLSRRSAKSQAVADYRVERVAGGGLLRHRARANEYGIDESTPIGTCSRRRNIDRPGRELPIGLHLASIEKLMQYAASRGKCR